MKIFCTFKNHVGKTGSILFQTKKDFEKFLILNNSVIEKFFYFKAYKNRGLDFKNDLIFISECR